MGVCPDSSPIQIRCGKFGLGNMSKWTIFKTGLGRYGLGSVELITNGDLMGQKY